MKSLLKSLSVFFIGIVFIFLLVSKTRAIADYSVYVTNYSTGDVSIVDPSTNLTVATIPFDERTKGISSYNPGNRMYVGGADTNHLYVVDTSTNTIITSIELLGIPFAVKASPDGNRVYAGIIGPNPEERYVSVIDTSTNTVIENIPGFLNPQGIDVSPDSSELYIVDGNLNRNNGSLTIIDTATFSTITTIELGVEPAAVVVSQDGLKIYVSEYGGDSLGNTIAVIDANDYSRVGTINVGINPLVLAISSNGERLYSMNTYYWAGGGSGLANGTISVIDTATDTVIYTITIGIIPNSIVLSPDDSKLYVAIHDVGGASNIIQEIDTNINEITDEIEVAAAPLEVATGPYPIAMPPSPTPTITPSPTPSPTPVTVEFNSSADTYVKSGQDNRNSGGGTAMKVQSSGNNRSLVRFDQNAIQSAVGSGTVLSAKVKLIITDNANNWGGGRTVDIHRLISDWAEGNGTEDNRGTGTGATWNCAIDNIIQNQSKDCSGASEWSMGQTYPWVSIPSDTETITNNQTGDIEYDVTSDVQSFVANQSSNYGWIIKKTNESQNGQVSFGTRESSDVPQLIITYQP